MFVVGASTVLAGWVQSLTACTTHPFLFSILKSVLWSKQPYVNYDIYISSHWQCSAVTIPPVAVQVHLFTHCASNEEFLFLLPNVNFILVFIFFKKEKKKACIHFVWRDSDYHNFMYIIFLSEKLIEIYIYATLMWYQQCTDVFKYKFFTIKL